MGYTLSRTEAKLSLEILIFSASMAVAGPNPYAHKTALSQAVVVSQGDDPFTWAPQPVEVNAGATAELTLDLEIPESCEIYRDKLSVRVVDSPGLKLGNAQIPEATHERAIHKQQFGTLRADTAITLPVMALGDRTGVQVVKLELTHQGCKGGLCYPEVVQQQEALIRIVPANVD